MWPNARFGCAYRGWPWPGIARRLPSLAPYLAPCGAIWPCAAITAADNGSCADAGAPGHAERDGTPDEVRPDGLVVLSLDRL